MDKKTKNALEVVFDYLKISDKPQKADVIFICGGSSYLPVVKAAELYKKGFAKKIVTISKWGTFSLPETKDKGEAYCFAQKLKKLGIPESDIFAKSIIRNTLEEVQKTVPFMLEHGVDTDRIIVVDRPFHQRRAWAQFTWWYPRLKFINVPADEPLKYDQNSINRAVAEIVRLDRYAKQDTLTPQKLPENVAAAYKLLRTKITAEL